MEGFQGTRELAGGRETQRLGQKPVSESRTHTQDQEAVVWGFWDLSPAHVAGRTPSFTKGQDPLTPKGSCLTSGTDPKGLTHLLRKFWRSCLVPVLLRPRESGEKMWKPVGSGEAHRTELASRMQLCKWLTRRQNQARLSGAAIFHPQTPAAGVGHPWGPLAEICYI